MSDDGKQLYRACDSSDPQEALQLSTSWDQQRIQDAAQYKDKHGYTPLHEACRYGHDKVLEMLLKHGADAEAKNDVSTIPPSSPLYPPMMLHLYLMMMMMLMLYLYVMLMHHPTVKVVEMLLKHGADAKAKTGVSTSTSLFSPSSPYDGAPVPYNGDDGDGDAVPYGGTPLHRACYYGHVKVVEILLKHGVYVEAKDNDSQTPLHYACTYGHDKVVEMLLKHGVYVEAKNNRGKTPLQLACATSSASRKVVQQLLRHGADPDARDLTDARPLDLLLGRDPIKLEVVAELLSATQTLCSYQTSNSDGANLIPMSSVGWRVDPQLFNIHDLQTLGDCVAALTSAAQAAPTN
ncbi:uncharacterized protein MONBRDRAFT_26336 [Monosiga brevicollis MX1]|uniref:Uncharacterized protein n=1 Tax=Monosiga brevicollis TaxID=81824 RepID=A9V227_MONBE|nr:uncharacterized protein MONBRDRAFT_26336 [Monosiga brevicollis MX1]EDQ88308.1 predicted protein [Monosiga brevicollis MX1]|eukprot:XP_001746901.1 hypothetical protein [Monosiga brevicollis MX1]